MSRSSTQRPSPPEAHQMVTASDGPAAGTRTATNSDDGNNNNNNGGVIGALLHWTLMPVWAATNGVKWAGANVAGFTVDHIAAPMVNAAKGLTPQEARDVSRILNDLVVEGAGLAMTREALALCSEAQQVGGLLLEEAASPEGRQLLVEGSTLCAQGMELVTSEGGRRLVEQGSVFVARLVDGMSRPKAKVVLEGVTKLVLRLLDIGKLPQATKVLATLTANGVHMLEMVHKAHRERGGEPSDHDNDDDDSDGSASDHDRTAGDHHEHAEETGGKTEGSGGAGDKRDTIKRVFTKEAELLRLSVRPAAASGPVDALPNAAATATAANAGSNPSRGQEAAADQTAEQRAGRTSRAGEAEVVPRDASVARDDGQDNGELQGAGAATAAAHGSVRENPRHGRALLPRFSAADFLPVLQGEPLPLSEKMAAPTETSMDETVARAAGRPWQAPSQSSQSRRRLARQRREGGCGRSGARWSWKQLILCFVVLVLAVDGLRSRAKGLFAGVGHGEGATTTTTTTPATATATRSATFPEPVAILPVTLATASHIDAIIDSSSGKARGARIPLTAPALTAPASMARKVLSFFSRRPTDEKDVATVSGGIETAPVPPPSPSSSPSRKGSLFSFSRRRRGRQEEEESVRARSDVVPGGGDGGEAKYGVRSKLSSNHRAQLKEASSFSATTTRRKTASLFRRRDRTAD